MRHNPLNKRFKRELFDDLGKNLALFLFLTVTIGFSAGYLVAGDSLIAAYNESFEKYNIEDGHFSLSDELPDTLRVKIENEKVRLFDLPYRNRTSNRGHTIRVYRASDRTKSGIDLFDIMKGSAPENKDEIVIDRLYAQNNGIQPGDAILIQNGEDCIRYTVSGFAALSDYSALFKNNADMMFDANKFTVALVNDAGFERMGDIGTVYCYAWKWEDHSLSGLDDESKRRAVKKSEDFGEALIDIVYDSLEDEIRDEVFKDILLKAGYDFSVIFDPEEQEDIEKLASERIADQNLHITDYVGRMENQAIQFTGDDFGGDKIMMEVLLYIVMGLIAYIFGISQKGTIEGEASSIGTLRALGFTGTEMLLHYLFVPTAITLLAALIGNISGYTFLNRLIAALYYHSYSLPSFEVRWNAEAFIRTTLIPCAIVIIVSALVLIKTMTLSPLQFLRHEFRRKTNSRPVSLKQGGIMRRFAIRVILQNLGAYAAIFFGVLFANLLLTFGIIFTPLLHHYQNEIRHSMIARYQYVLKTTRETDTPNAEKYTFCSLDYKGGEISVYGIEEDSSYLPDLNRAFTRKDFDDDLAICASHAFLDKYRLKVGDEISMKEKYGKDTYSFKIVSEFNYNAALSVYMPIEHYRTVFDKDDDFFNGYYTNKRLRDIPARDIASVITEHDLAVVAEQLEDSMGMMFPLFGGFAVILYILILFLLSNLITRKNEKSISMLKILGYHSREAARIYNTSTAAVVIGSMLISIPFNIVMMHLVFRLLLLRFNGYLSYYMAPWVMPSVVFFGMAGFCAVSLLQTGRVRRISLATALKSGF